ncbi:MAG: redoxin domain-containing protein [Eubacteriales bacterium]
MRLIAVGDIAPDFLVKDQNSVDVSLHDFIGKKVLMSWHPLAWTPVCTDQMRSIENNYDTFLQLNTIPLGFSVDPQPCKAAWATALVIQKLRMPSDFWPHGQIAQKYGIFDENKGVSERVNIIVDEKGKVCWIKGYPSGELPNIQEVIQFLSNH